MERINSFSLEQFQDEIGPILNKILDDSTPLKEILQKYGVLEAAEFQIKLNTNKLRIKEIELKGFDELQPNFNMTKVKFQFQEIKVHCTEYCRACDCYLECGTCPQ